MNKQIIEKELEMEISGEKLLFHCSRVIFWPQKKTLLLSDPHFGKVSHFRKGGIAVPNQMLEENYRRLESSIHHYSPERVIILGDLFHSVRNQEWELLKDFVNSFSEVDFQLVLGNHDILAKNEWYDSKFEIFVDHLIMQPFILTHFPLELPHKKFFNLAGHVHPGVRLSGGPAQSVKLPCFYFNNFQGILPAFSDFSGSYKLRPKSGDKVIAIAANQLILFE